MKEGFDEASLHFEAEEVEVTCGFPVGELGVPKYPFAKALVAIAKDHFEFATAEEQGFTPTHGARDIEQRMTAMEDMLRQLQSGLAGLQPSALAVLAPQLNQAEESGWRDRTASQSCLHAGLDPGLARKALQSWISHAALGELA